MKTKHYYRRTSCRVCGSRKLEEVLNLGSTALANAFVPPGKEKGREETFPLQLIFCPSCSLVQLKHVVDPKVLFKGYHYLTSGSPVLIDHFHDEADSVLKRYGLKKDDLAVEIGSNDGVLLSHIQNQVRVLGIDPAETAAKEAAKRGVTTVVDFFDADVAKNIIRKHGHAKVIFANNVIAHIDDLDSVFHGVQTLLHDDGAFITEVHWVGNLVGDGGFDQIYHEHLSYFSLHALSRLAERFELVITDVELVPIHGQSLRVYMQKRGKPSTRVHKFLKREKRLRLNSMIAYKRFAPKVEKNKRELRKLLNDLKKKKVTIAGYGASAKGNTLLNYMRITKKHLDFITDTIPLKQGTFTPGARIPVVPPDMLFSKRPDYLLLLAWNYAPSILHKERALRAQGTKFIIPVPQVRVV
jgi:C-methyltransferase C-terminal domain/Putative zinc binding domain/Methyltransferase domain